MTYSIVARDPVSGRCGVAVQSHFFGTRSVVPWAAAGVGAVATQSFAQRSFGPRGLELMRSGRTAPDALASLLADEDDASIRQVALLDSRGTAAVHTGRRCLAAAGHRVEPNVAAQANMAADPAVWNVMIECYLASNDPFEDRLLNALRAAESAGGDIRGRQSACILVAPATESGQPGVDLLIDMRVDDHADPLTELGRLLRLRAAYAKIGAALELILGSEVPDDARCRRADADLRDAQGTLGTNLEPTFWRCVLLARAGHGKQARNEVREASRRQPQWAELFERVGQAGLLGDVARVDDT